MGTATPCPCSYYADFYLLVQLLNINIKLSTKLNIGINTNKVNSAEQAALCRHFALASAGEIFFFAVYAAFLLIMLCSDLEQQIIPDKLLALFAILGLLHSLLFGEVWLPHVTAALLGGLIFLLLAIITRGGIGGGDIKLIAALGLWLGPSPLKAAALGGIIIGGIWALLAVLLTKKSRRDVIPYGPSFILAALFAYAAYLLPG